MKIIDIDTFTIHLPVPDGEQRPGQICDYGLTQVRTDEGITGLCFVRTPEEILEREVRPALLGADPRNVEQFVPRGLYHWPAVEHALWDIIGKAAGMPVRKLLGGSREAIPCYLTCVWPGAADQTDVTPQQQANRIEEYAEMGFRAVKVRAWRPNPLQDVEVCRLVRQQVGRREVMEVMFDRTAQYAGSVWDYDTAYRVARALEEVDATWLEEPFERGDIEKSARLAAAVDIPITGGEGDRGVEKFRFYLVNHSFDIIQPDAMNSGGLLAVRKISAMAEAFGVPCILHGSHGLALAGWLQILGAIPNCRILEVAIQHPGLTPQEQWAPAMQVLNSDEVFHVEKGEIHLPAGPGLGLDVNEAALETYQVSR
jgi:D-galactarolactone cycloisomerase